jgi:hypothetical protein
MAPPAHPCARRLRVKWSSRNSRSPGPPTSAPRTTGCKVWPATAGVGSLANSSGTTRKPMAVRLPHQRAPPAPGAVAARSIRRSADRHDLVALDAAGRLHFGGVALFLADQRARDRAGDVDQALLQVGLVLADDLVLDLVAGLLFLELDGGAEHDLAAGVQLRRIDDLRGRQLALELADAAFDEALAVLGGVVLGVLRQVALRARLGDGVDHPGPLHGLELVQFGLELSRCRAW